MKKNKLLIADDHHIMIDGLIAILSDVDSVEIVGTVSNGKEAVELAGQLEPDIILMDIDMPIMNGMVASKMIKEKHPQIKIVILSLHMEMSIINHLIQLGVDGYLVKNDDAHQVISAIESVLDGKKFFSTEVTLALSGNKHKTSVENNDSTKLSLLTERELEILKLIVEGFSNKEIASQLFLSPRTVDAHRSNLMGKLEIHKVTGLVRFAMRTGLID